MDTTRNNDELETPSQTTQDSENAGSLPHPSYEELETQLTLAEQQSHENWDKMTRAVAELENVRRRAQREVEQAHKYSVEKLLASLLPILDSLEQASQLAAKEVVHASMLDGLDLTIKLFLEALNKHGVQQLDPLGELFNPQEHEAMSMQELADAVPNSIVTVFQKGYRLNDRVIRHARVIVAKTISDDKKN
ncbi:MAG: nucleotide exchange factor GrpE [Legionellales bacterium RIFCSPHIGHO2_12_FULL_42_9]|nr:MAG: nucleotide exchange factor GrpE [Legionellales bacterium RIFCSPHIGHO2_12_FULL_42_9]